MRTEVFAFDEDILQVIRECEEKDIRIIQSTSPRVGSPCLEAVVISNREHLRLRLIEAEFVKLWKASCGELPVPHEATDK